MSLVITWLITSIMDRLLMWIIAWINKRVIDGITVRLCTYKFGWSGAERKCWIFTWGFNQNGARETFGSVLGFSIGMIVLLILVNSFVTREGSLFRYHLVHLVA